MWGNNKGSAALEATLALPVFLIFMLALYLMHESREAELIVYEASAETAEYMAEVAYIDETAALAVPLVKFRSYLDDEKLVERFVDGGASGVWFLGSYIDEEDYLHLSVSYRVKVSLPFLPELSSLRHYEIRQRVYRGTTYSGEGSGEQAEDGRYVYVTDNREVYHTSRACTHLTLRVEETGLAAAKASGYTPCEFCGALAGDCVYITPEGDRYHSTSKCSGLKRTVKRVPVSKASDLCECSRCAATRGGN